MILTSFRRSIPPAQPSRVAAGYLIELVIAHLHVRQLREVSLRLFVRQLDPLGFRQRLKCRRAFARSACSFVNCILVTSFKNFMRLIIFSYETAKIYFNFSIARFNVTPTFVTVKPVNSAISRYVISDQ